MSGDAQLPADSNTTEVDASVEIDAQEESDAAPAGSAECIGQCDTRKATNDVCFDDDYDRCIAHCDSYDEWNSETKTIFETCLLEDPLCFQTIDQCVLIKLYPEGTDVTVVFKGEGYDEHNGKTIFAKAEPLESSDMASGLISEGTFEVEWGLNGPVWSDFKTVVYFVDINGNSVCDGGTDIVYTGHARFVGTFASPVYELGVDTVPDTASNSTQICNLL